MRGEEQWVQMQDFRNFVIDLLMLRVRWFSGTETVAVVEMFMRAQGERGAGFEDGNEAREIGGRFW